MGFKDRFTNLRKPSDHHVRQPARPDAVEGADERIKALEALHRAGSMTDRELSQARRRILDGKD